MKLCIGFDNQNSLKSQSSIPDVRSLVNGQTTGILEKNSGIEFLHAFFMMVPLLLGAGILLPENPIATTNLANNLKVNTKSVVAEPVSALPSRAWRENFYLK
jgi:hypothetical protein